MERRELCLNCGSEVTGPYCAACGQSVRELGEPLGTFLREAGEDLMDWDRRILRTIRGLLLRPGELTKEFLAGRRIRYVHPVRLFLATGAIAMAALAFIPTGGSRGLLYLFGGGVIGRGAEWVPGVVLIALAPAYAALLRGLFIRADRTYVEHLVFVVHGQSFVYLAMAAEAMSVWAATSMGFGRELFLSIFLFVAAAYLVLALRVAYEESWDMTMIKAMALALAHVGGVGAVLLSMEP